MADKLVKLHFKKQSCRAVVLHMDQAWQEIIEHHELPRACAHAGRAFGRSRDACREPQVRRRARAPDPGRRSGEACDRRSAHGPHRARDGAAAGAAETIAEDADFKSLVNANGNGRCALILDMASRRPGEHPYQGVVPLTGNTVAETIESYMTQSEQVRTGLWLAADDKAAGGVLLQHVATTGGKAVEDVDPEGFDHLSVLAKTVKNEEILGLDAEEVARRLFWEDNPAVLEELKPKFACRCSIEGIKAMVKSLGEQEANEIVAEKGRIEVRCEFCGKTYTLDPIDVKMLFANNTQAKSKTIN